MRYGQQSDRSIPGVAYMDSYLLFWAGLQSCWHSLLVAGFDSLSIRTPWLAVKSHCDDAIGSLWLSGG